MKTTGQQDKIRSVLTSILVLFCILLASCSSNTGGGTTGPIAAGGKGCTKVGVLLPEITASRWETVDHPLLEQAIKMAIPAVHIDYSNAHSDSAAQISQAEQDLANGDCILVVGAHDSVAAAAIVAKAHAQNVPVIAYDRLIQSKDLNYYVSFNNTQVGQMQGQYIVDHYLDYGVMGKVNMAMISGSQTDNNALFFSMGAHNALDPLFANGDLNNVSEIFTPNWDPATAQTEIEAILANQQDNIQIAYVANDDMANAVITALKATNQAGHVLVTGQDATVAGIHNILAGQQSMTIYKPIAKEAQSVGLLVQALYSGSSTMSLTQGSMVTTYNGENIPAILDAPISVNINNVASTVIADHFVTKAAVCAGIPAGTAGVC